MRLGGKRALGGGGIHIKGPAKFLYNPRDKKKTLEDKKILINAGPTREYLDPVRFISNPSSGRMGFALAEEAAARGAQVALVSGPVSLPSPPGVRRVDVVSAEQMFRACKQEFPTSDVFIASAAVGDFVPSQTVVSKIKKNQKNLSLNLKPTVDVLKTLGLSKRSGQILVGFAAETDHLLKSARNKLKEKNLDLVVANEISERNPGFSAEKNQVFLIPKRGSLQRLPPLPKREVASRILDWVENKLR